jgi:hypothetical protein
MSTNQQQRIQLAFSLTSVSCLIFFLWFIVVSISQLSVPLRSAYVVPLDYDHQLRWIDGKTCMGVLDCGILYCYTGNLINVSGSAIFSNLEPGYCISDAKTLFKQEFDSRGTGWTSIIGISILLLQLVFNCGILFVPRNVACVFDRISRILAVTSCGLLVLCPLTDRSVFPVNQYMPWSLFVAFSILLLLGTS